jgi:uncharacterized protein YndB with AHSA1/START domain
MGTLPRTGQTEVEAAATPEQVWALLADVTRTGEWSHETQGGEWLDGASGAAPGARFRGRNRNGRTRWSRVCEVLAADAPRAISWRTVPSRLYRDSTVWTYELTPTADGCRITQRFEVLRLGPVLDRLFYAAIPAHRDRTVALAEDIRHLGEVAAAEQVAPAAPASSGGDTQP